MVQTNDLYGSINQWLTENPPATAVAIPMIADSGNQIFEYVTETFQVIGQNAVEVYKVVTGSAGALVSTGVAAFTMEIPAAVALASVPLGLLAGVGMYNLAPDFWDGIGEPIGEWAFETINKRALAFYDSFGHVYMPESNIQQFGKYLITHNILATDVLATIVPSIREFSEKYGISFPINARVMPNIEVGKKSFTVYGSTKTAVTSTNPIRNVVGSDIVYCAVFMVKHSRPGRGGSLILPALFSKAPFTYDAYFDMSGWSHYSARYWTYGEFSGYVSGGGMNPSNVDMQNLLGLSEGDFYPTYVTDGSPSDDVTTTVHTVGVAFLNSNITGLSGALQPGAQYPTIESLNDIKLNFPDWYTKPDTNIMDGSLFDVTGAIPDVIPNPTQGLVWNAPDTSIGWDLDALKQWLLDYFPSIGQVRDGTITLDYTDAIPDAIDQTGEITIPIPDNPAKSDPIPLDITVPPGTIIPPAVLPSSPLEGTSHKLWTAYSVTAVELDPLGAFLWGDSFIDILDKIWFNPMSAIISLHGIYKAPGTLGGSTIHLGQLDTQILAPVCAQYNRFSCGSVSVSEFFKSSFDYPPYTNLSIYLPFIGIVDLDASELMNSSIEVVYGVDAYNGSTLAELWVTDPSDGTRCLYSFEGNCAVRYPLTGNDNSGILRNAIQIGGAIASAAINPAIGAISAVSALGNFIGGNKSTVQRSGGFAGNAGALGEKIPFLIIDRQMPYDANNYASLYGYPAHKAVYLGNCNGFVRCSNMQLTTRATEAEKKEIERLCHEGIFM